MSEDVAITDREFELFRALILKETGILLTEHKRPLLCSRLAKRLRRLELSSFSEYYEYLRKRDPEREERRELVNCITTNKTEFFRESHHFEFLQKRVLGPLARSAAAGGERKLRIWSAACSTGEEPYSIAMTVADVLQPLDDWDVRILASDIDTHVLERAERGRYSRDVLEPISPERRRRWCRPLGKEEFEIDPGLRQLVTFRQINFVREPWPIRARFDVIFCRNVMIYFGRDTQERIYTRFHELLKPGGFLVAGHSENLLFMAHLFEPVGHTVYRRRSSGQSRRSMRPPVHLRGSRPPAGAAEREVARAAPSRPPSRRRSSAQRRAARARDGRASKRPSRVSLISGSRTGPSPGRSHAPKASRPARARPSSLPSERAGSSRAAPRVDHPAPTSRSPRPPERASLAASARAAAPRPSVSATPPAALVVLNPPPIALRVAFELPPPDELLLLSQSPAPRERPDSKRPDSKRLDSKRPSAKPKASKRPAADHRASENPTSKHPTSDPKGSRRPLTGQSTAARSLPATEDEPRQARIVSGELFASDTPAVVSTLLGSCVAACVYDRERGIGGMNHFMLPSGQGGHGYNAICFGTNAMELLINELLRLGARRDCLQARAFGAAHVIAGAELQAQVSVQNARFIREFLTNERIPLLEQSLGGERPLLVSFETHTGRASARIAGEAAAEVAQDEARFKARIDRDPGPEQDNVTLF